MTDIDGAMSPHDGDVSIDVRDRQSTYETSTNENVPIEDQL
jgi:hypothetical protein